MRLTLASRSPRRRELLEALGFALEVRPADADETPLPGEGGAAYVRRVARAKARAVEPADGAVVLAADTAVVLRGEILGKPADAEDARRMLRALSGSVHEVTTGVCVRGGAREEGVEVTTEVRFTRLTEAQVAWYAATAEPYDKAGGYALQGLAGAFVERVDGSVSNVVGLPVAETLALLARAGVRLPWEGP